MIKFVLFDLDDTIFDFHKAEHMAIAKTLESLKIPSDDKKLQLYSEINKSQWKRLEKKEITREQLKIIRFRIFLDCLGYPQLDAVAVGKTYENFLSQGHYYIDNALQVVKDLSKDYRLFLVSNGLSNVQRGRLSDSEVKDYFENIFISEEMGVNKPQKEFFDYCFNMIKGLKKDETVIVGDSLSSDIQGGINANIKTIWLNKRKEINDGKIIPNYTINSISELKNVLEKM